MLLHGFLQFEVVCELRLEGLHLATDHHESLPNLGLTTLLEGEPGGYVCPRCLFKNFLGFSVLCGLVINVTCQNPKVLRTSVFVLGQFVLIDLVVIVINTFGSKDFLVCCGDFLC